jgi:hypothetical protein
MKKKGRLSDQPSWSRSSAISKSALADFLVQLATLYASPEFGNPAVATALRELANSVRRNVPYGARDSRSSSERPTTQPTLEFELLRGLDRQAVERFIADETKSKNELLDLAVARFSIPRSQLKRMKVADVRQVINSALLHESSIEILSEEAKRDGLARSS